MHHGKDAVITIVFVRMVHDLIYLSTDNIHLIELVSTRPSIGKYLFFLSYKLCVFCGDFDIM